MDTQTQDTSNEPRIGVQLYTVRNLTGGDAFKDTLRALADLGFQGVEFAWKYGGMDPAGLAAFLQSIDLACCGLHVQLGELLEPDHLVHEYAQAARSEFITTSLCKHIDEWNTLLPRVDEAAAIAADKGLTFTYHNHWQEFESTEEANAFERLVAGTNSELVRLELDLGWVRKAGGDPMSVWREHGDRIPQIHLRDYDMEGETVCDLGDGFIDVQAVFDRARELGTRWLIYEQDTYPVSPLESCRVCMARLNEGR